AAVPAVTTPARGIQRCRRGGDPVQETLILLGLGGGGGQVAGTGIGIGGAGQYRRSQLYRVVQPQQQMGSQVPGAPARTQGGGIRPSGAQGGHQVLTFTFIGVHLPTVAQGG